MKETWMALVYILTLRRTSLLPFSEKINNKKRVSYHEKGPTVPPSLIIYPDYFLMGKQQRQKYTEDTGEVSSDATTATPRTTSIKK